MTFFCQTISWLWVLTKLEMGILKFLPVLLLLHLISYIDVECAQIKCKIGVERYHNGDCVKCTCSEGNGLSISQVGQSQTWPQNIAKEKKSIITTTNLTIAQNDFLWVDAVQGRYDVPALLALLGWWVFWTQNRSSLCQLLDFLWDSKQSYRETMWRKKWRDLWTVSARVSASSDFLIQPPLWLIATLKW